MFACQVMTCTMYLCSTQILLCVLPFDVGMDSNIKHQSICTGSSTTVILQWQLHAFCCASGKQTVEPVSKERKYKQAYLLAHAVKQQMLILCQDLLAAQLQIRQARF